MVFDSNISALPKEKQIIINKSNHHYTARQGRTKVKILGNWQGC